MQVLCSFETSETICRVTMCTSKKTSNTSLIADYKHVSSSNSVYLIIKNNMNENTKNLHKNRTGFLNTYRTLHKAVTYLNAFYYTGLNDG